MDRLYKIAVLLLALSLGNHLFASGNSKIIVSADDKGDYHTIQQAIESLSDSSLHERNIYIKNGNYHEKVMIKKNNVIIEGESKDGVVIFWGIAREEWRCSHKDDWGVATINVDADDVTLKNLTVKNSFGFDWKHDIEINCLNDSSQKRVIKRTGHQMTIRTMSGTRFKAINCHIISYAGDTMSPWNVYSGMYYFKDCIIEGGVDLYCPRGWAYAENCTFIASIGEAAIWHDGSASESSKAVFKNCFFDGYEGFALGRYHKDAQFYLLDCRFSNKLADKAIYKVGTKNEIKWGHRVYYYNCHREGGDYNWFADNISVSGTEPNKVSVNWVFEENWNPVKN